VWNTKKSNEKRTLKLSKPLQHKEKREKTTLHQTLILRKV